MSTDHDAPTGEPKAFFTPLDLLARLFDHSGPSAQSGRSGRTSVAPRSTLKRLLWPFLEGIVITGCALWAATAIQVPQSGFFAVFLAAAGLSGRLDELLDDNRRNIYERALSSWRANSLTATSVLALFLGMFSAFIAAALLLGEARMSTEFRFVLAASRLGGDTLFAQALASAPGIFAYNLFVLLVFFGLAFVYRSYGALLSLAWSACVWGLVVAFLVRRGLVGGHSHAALFLPLSTVAVLPHLILEASAYVIGSLAAIYMSKAITQYGTSNRALLWQITRAVGILLAVSIACLLLGALVESFLPRLVMSFLLR